MRFALTLLCLLTLSGVATSAEVYDLVILNGRVMDPESGLDAVRNVGIRDGVVSTVTAESLEGHTTLDANGKVVAPGFIDIHSHTPTLLGQHANLLDGVTTQLELELGAFPVTGYGDHYRGGAQINYGASVSHAIIRMRVMEGFDWPYLINGQAFAKTGGPAWTDAASTDDIAAMRALLEEGLDQGGLGIGVVLDYMTRAISDAELRMIFEVAGERAAPVFVHVRRGLPGDPTGLQEVLALAESSGAPLLINHITHSAMGGIDKWLAMIDAANARGARVTTETLSYAAGGTSINADVFRFRDWQKIFDITYGDVQWVATGEWLTEERWNYYAENEPMGMVNHHYVKEAWIESAMRWPGMMISTDALPAVDRDILTNPNVSGTYSRFLGHYVRERQVLPLMDALARISLLPARWLAQVAPLFTAKGRIQVGADADIVVFDPAVIQAGADYGKPYVPPVGISHVLVGGRIVVRDGQRIEGRYPGRLLLATP